ncbi:hypothetical protein [Falsochrobactrum shanghaiense]|uniref:hypothetical protein n=1 Tax=Falsochrobactrum shanghaiense TaxID=2201899 RepID=UPI001304EB9B|nr:hypothetical protein [Falsochrobactrum shanghaiense]
MTVATGLTVMVSLQFLTTWLNGSFEPVTYSGIVSLFYVSFGVFLAISAYFTEHVDRPNFLNHLHGKKLQAELTKPFRADAMTGLNNRRMPAPIRNRIWKQPLPARSYPLS